LHHALDFFLREASLVIGDCYAVLFAGGLVGGSHVKNIIGIDIEGDLVLRDSTWGGRDSGKFKFTEQVVVLGTGSFTVTDLNEDIRLVVGVGREDFGFFSWS
jgi:hypothetical protein